MKVARNSNLPNITTLKGILISQSALDIIMNKEEDSWLRVSSYYKNYIDGVDFGKIYNGAGDHMNILFSRNGVIIKGFDHESILSPYCNEENEIAKGIYDNVPKELMKLLSDESLEVDDVTFCLWREKADSTWKKGDVTTPEEYEEDDDGEGFLTGYIFEDAKSWVQWAQYYYNKEIPLEYVKVIYENKKITRDVIEKINPERNIYEAIKELEVIGYIVLN